MDYTDTLASSFQLSDIVTITLQDGGAFQLQEAWLCSISKYFAKALKGGFAEGQSHTLQLPGCTTSTFKLFLHWLCQHNLPDPPTPLSETHQVNLVSLWIFGDMIALPRLQNAAIAKLESALGKSKVFVTAVQTAYGNTSESSILRDYVTRKVIEFLFERQGYIAQEKDELGSIAGFLAEFTLLITYA